MTADARQAAPGLRPGGFDPLRTVWKLLCNAKFALLLVGLAGVAGMIGVVVPQMPSQMRGNPAARSAWLELRRDDFGPFTKAMERLDLFEVFYSPWFIGLWMVIIVAVTVCTVSRFRPTARSVHRPAKDVSARYFETAHHRADFSHPGGVEAVEAALRRRRYRVERTRTADGASYVFAERFAWSAYGTFASHLALLLLLVGGLLTRLAGFDRTLVIAEGRPAAPVFDQPGPGQLFVKVIDAYRGLDAGGNIVDYHSMLEVTRGGRTKTCKTTVNDPCEAFGYKVHQAAFIDDIAHLRVLGPDGRVLYDDVLDFDSQTTAVPWLRVTDANGAVLFDQELPQMGTDTGTDPGPADDLALAVLAFPKSPGAAENESLAVSWRVEGNDLRLAIAGPDLQPEALVRGRDVAAGAYRVQYTGARNIPAIRVDDMPGAAAGGAVVQMPVDHDGHAYLLATGLDGVPLVLTEGTNVTNGDGYTYAFAGRVEASGVSVRRDPGDTFIWVAVVLALIGLGITFYVPRRRLWVKVTPGRTYMAGIAERTTRFGRELRQLGAALGSRDALRPEDLE